jgi:myo-inositol catabolism protein IolC
MPVALGYDGKLYILAFDHRGSFKKAVIGRSSDLTEEENERIRDAKRLIFEGVQAAADRGADAHALGVLVDEEFGSDVPERAKSAGMVLAMPVEKSGQDEFDFEYGDNFGDHIESFDPDFSKVLVRFNPEGDAGMNQRQLERLRRLSDWLHERGRKFLFELLVPAEPAQLEAVGGDADRYDADVRPGLMRQAIQEIQDAGIEVDIWKIEGVDRREDCEMLAEQCRSGSGRENVACVVLGRGANNDKVDHWLTQAAPVDAFVGFAIGRSIWSEPLKGYLDGAMERDKAAAQIGDNYLRFVSVYEAAQ